MNKLIVIPARGGSKGIHKKNIALLQGKPLLTYTIELALDAQLDNTDIVVSTDAEDIMDVARDYSNIHIIRRPDDLACDTASTEVALIHAIDSMEALLGKKYDAVITLQPTSPLRNVETFRDFVQKYEDNDQCDAMLALTEDRTDFWIKNENGCFQRRDPSAPRRRQDRTPLYKENSAYYITDVSVLKDTMSVLGRKVEGYIISDFEGIDINEPLDLLIADAAMRYRKEKLQSV